MPQKRNPISSEMMLAAAKIVREQHSAMLDAVVQDHERATGQWHVEWQVMPTAFIVASGGLQARRARRWKASRCALRRCETVTLA
jgi:3-carboxy-cis,cis-muconate cycloisomerase